MPWNSEGGGGGGGQGPWGQGPWGQGGGPRRPNPGGRGPNPPDLDDLIRKGQDKLKQVLPQGGGGYVGWLLGIGFIAAGMLLGPSAGAEAALAAPPSDSSLAPAVAGGASQGGGPAGGPARASGCTGCRARDSAAARARARAA